MNDKPDEDQSQAARPGVEGWDRIGEFMGRAGDTGQVIAKRHLEVWNAVSTSLRDPDYGANQWARNSALVAASMLDDVQDVIGLLTTTPDRRPAAGALPTVFLFIETDEEQEGEDRSPRDQWIIAPSGITPLPDDARIELSGGSSTDAATNVRNTITVGLDDKSKRSYVVEYSRPKPGTKLETGGYVGVIYLRDGPSSRSRSPTSASS